MGRLDPNMHPVKKFYWNCKFVVIFWYWDHVSIPIQRVTKKLKDKWLTFKYRREAAEVREKYLNKKGNIWPHDDNFME